MDDLNKEKIREQIKIEIENTKRSISEYEALIHPIVPDCSLESTYRIESINNQEIAKQALEKALLKLKNLNFARQNIDKKGFGVCANCGEDIPIGRILLVPHIKFCVKCAH